MDLRSLTEIVFSCFTSDLILCLQLNLSAHVGQPIRGMYPHIFNRRPGVRQLRSVPMRAQERGQGG